MKVTSIEAKAIRGLPKSNGTLEVGERGLILCGPNGSGKSSVVDSIELALGCESTLFAETAQGVNWNLAGPHIVDGNPKVSLCITSGSTSIVVGTGVDKSSLSREASDWIDAARDATFVLRRHKLLGFITLRPGDRYKALEPFLSLAKYNELESVVIDQTSKTARELAVEIEEKDTFEREFEELFAGKKVDTDVEELFEQTRADLRSLLSSEEFQTNDVSQFNTILLQKQRTLDNSKVFSELSRLKDNCQFIENLDLREKADAAYHTLSLLEETEDWQDNVANAELLILGKSRIKNVEKTECPLCESVISGIDVNRKIETRLKDVEIAKTRYDDAKKQISALSVALGGVSARLTSIQTDWELHFDSKLPDLYANFVSAVSKIPSSVDRAVLHEKEVKSNIEELIRGIGAIPLSSSIDTKLKEFENFDILSSVRLGLNRLNVLTEKLAIRKQKNSQMDLLKDVAKALTSLSTFAENGRKKAVQEVFDEVVTTANQFYDILHPNEDIGHSRLEVRHAVSNSVQLRSYFHGHEEDPRLHYSESHLDTLGLCFFLAIRRFECNNNPSFNLLVLDDVIHSVDSQHRERFVELIANEFSDHQVVLTTHDSLLFSFLTTRLPRKKFVFSMFTGWSLKDGPRLAVATSDFQKISDVEMRSKIHEDDICAAIGRFMESIARDLAERLAVSTLFTKKPTLEVLWIPVDTRLRESVGFKTVGEEILGNVTRNRWFRNQCGAHHNPTEAPLTHSEVCALADNVTKLRDLLFCDDCGSSIKRVTDNDWNCNCGLLSYKKKTT